MKNITESSSNCNTLTGNPNNKSNDIPNILSKTKVAFTFKKLNLNKVTSTTNDSTGHNLFSFESNSTSKKTLASKPTDTHAHMQAIECNTHRASVEEGANYQHIENFNTERKEMPCSERKLEITKSRQFKLQQDGLTVIKKKNIADWELNSSFAEQKSNMLKSFSWKKKGYTHKQAPSEQLKKMISGIKVDSKEKANLEGKKKKAYMNILNVIYQNHIKKKGT